MTSQDTGNAAGAGGMMTTMDCIPCFIRQALEAARLATHDPEIQARIMRQARSSSCSR